MRTAPEVADIIKGFPNPELTKIRGKPSRAKIIQMEKELKANASSVETQLGGGANGHLGLMMTAADYATWTPTIVATLSISNANSAFSNPVRKVLYIWGEEREKLVDRVRH